MTNQKRRPAGCGLRSIRWMLLCGLLGLAVSRPALATDPVYPPSPEVLAYTIPPDLLTIDASNFVNNLSFTITFTPATVNPQLLETWNTINYTNNGWMVANALTNNGTGFYFDTFLPESSSHLMAGTFFNSGFIDCNSINDNPNKSTNSVGQCIVMATNVICPGFITVGQGGLMRLTGQNVDLSYGTLTMEGSMQTSLTGTAGFTVLDESVGIDANGLWQPSVALTPNSATNEYNITPLPNYYMALSNSTPYFENPAFAGNPNRTNVVRAIFIQNPNPNISSAVYFDPAAFADGAAHVAFFAPTYMDPATGLLNTNYIILSDFYKKGANQPAVGADGLPSNYTITMTNTVYPPALLTALGAPTPSGWATIQGGNTFLPAYPAAVTNNGYAYASVQFQSTTTPTNNPTQKPIDYLATNLTGRIQISAGNLSMPLVTISGENYLLLQATNHFSGSSGAQIYAPYSDIKLAVTNGSLTLTNLLEPATAAWNGNMRVWTSDWFYTDPVSGNNWDFRTLFIQLSGATDQSQLTASTPAAVWDMNLHVKTNLVICDVFNLLHSLYTDATGLLLTANGFGAAAPDGELNLLFAPTPPYNLWSNSVPNLRSLTNNGSIRMQSFGLFGGPSSPYLTLINNGLISDVGAQIWANNFENGGTFANGAGAFSLSAVSATFTNGSLSAAGDIVISAGTLLASNVVILAPKSLTITGTNQLTDGGPGNGSVFTVGSASVGNGFSLPINPRNGDLLGTTITNYAPVTRHVINLSAGLDMGAVPAGFTNNLAIGRLILDSFGPANTTWFYFTGPGGSNAIYVDHLELLGNCDYATNAINGFNGTKTIPALHFNTNLVIYYATAVSDGQDVSAKINGGNTNHLRWVPTYAGYYSTTNVVVNGVTVSFNSAAYPTTDSDADGIVNPYDPNPFFLSSQVNLVTYPTNHPAHTMAISWTTIPLATNSVYYSTNLVTWRLLTNIYIPTEPFIWPTPYPGPATNVMVFDPMTVPGRFYRVSVEPWLTYPF